MINAQKRLETHKTVSNTLKRQETPCHGKLKTLYATQSISTGEKRFKTVVNALKR
jgi:hypothetical protein